MIDFRCPKCGSINIKIEYDHYTKTIDHTCRKCDYFHEHKVVEDEIIKAPKTFKKVCSKCKSESIMIYHDKKHAYCNDCMGFGEFLEVEDGSED